LSSGDALLVDVIDRHAFRFGEQLRVERNLFILAIQKISRVLLSFRITAIGTSGFPLVNRKSCESPMCVVYARVGLPCIVGPGPGAADLGRK
jgi:hypothetical protein